MAAARVDRGTPVRERAFHAWAARHLAAGRSGLLPLGDDAAALAPPSGAVAVLTTDALVEGTHFLPRSPPGRIGEAATGVSLSDLAAKGARPVAVLLALIVPPGTPLAWPRAVVEGAETAARRFGSRVVGGDTKAGPVRTVVSCALGWGDPRHLAPRRRARVGDVLVTTGSVGRGGLAASALDGRRPPTRAGLVALLDVRPRVREGMALARFAHAMLDTSDGLAESARLLASASRVRVVVEEDRLPWAPGLARRGISRADRRALAFFGGDYELLAAVAPDDLVRAERAVARSGGRLTPVGSVARGRGAWLVADGRVGPMPAPGWDPFRAGGFRTGGRRTVRHPHRVHVTLK